MQVTPISVQERRSAQPRERLRVAFVAGTLVADGAEKQLVYMARALRDARVEVGIYCLTQGEFYEGVLTALQLSPTYFGGSSSRLGRLLTLIQTLRAFRPHIVQSAHFYTNLYASLAATFYKAVAIGCSRNDVFSELIDCGRLGKWSLRRPASLIVNSHAAKRNAQSFGVGSESIHVLGNVIDLQDFDKRAEAISPPLPYGSMALAIGRLVPQKRLDLFLAALAKARRSVANLRGRIVGEGPDQDSLKRAAEALGLLPDHLAFLGRRHDVPALLRHATMPVLSSSHEGFPNVVLEAMAARLPVITTPAGDAACIVRDGVSGCIAPFDDVNALAARMIQLSQDPALCKRYGEAGRLQVEQHYGYEGLANRLLAIYQQIGIHQNRRSLTDLLAGYW